MRSRPKCNKMLDNSAVVLALESMYTKRPVLMEVILQIANLCCQHHITIRARVIVGSIFNLVADGTPCLTITSHRQRRNVVRCLCSPSNSNKSSSPAPTTASPSRRQARDVVRRPGRCKAGKQRPPNTCDPKDNQGLHVCSEKMDALLCHPQHTHLPSHRAMAVCIHRRDLNIYQPRFHQVLTGRHSLPPTPGGLPLGSEQLRTNSPYATSN